MSESRPAEEAMIGPGRLILVVGPSGAGKDTLIAAARQRLGADPGFLFPRRVVTRPPTADEDNIFADAETFAAMAAAGGFALAWSAHGHSYGLPAAIDHALHEGRTVVCNVSRAVLPAARRRYGSLTVVEVTAPAAVLLARIAARQRSSDGDAAQRVDRQVGVAVEPDVCIVNDGPLAPAVEKFLATLCHSLEKPGSRPWR